MATQDGELVYQGDGIAYKIPVYSELSNYQWDGDYWSIGHNPEPTYFELDTTQTYNRNTTVKRSSTGSDRRFYIDTHGDLNGFTFWTYVDKRDSDDTATSTTRVNGANGNTPVIIRYDHQAGGLEPFFGDSISFNAPPTQEWFRWEFTLDWSNETYDVAAYTQSGSTVDSASNINFYQSASKSDSIELGTNSSIQWWDQLTFDGGVPRESIQHPNGERLIPLQHYSKNSLKTSLSGNAHISSIPSNQVDTSFNRELNDGTGYYIYNYGEYEWWIDKGHTQGSPTIDFNNDHIYIEASSSWEAQQAYAVEPDPRTHDLSQYNTLEVDWSCYTSGSNYWPIHIGFANTDGSPYSSWDWVERTHDGETSSTQTFDISSVNTESYFQVGIREDNTNSSTYSTVELYRATLLE